MLNKAERAEMEKLNRDNAYLRRRLDAAEEKTGKAQETVADLELMFEQLELDTAKVFKGFKQVLVERLTGTPPEDQN